MNTVTLPDPPLNDLSGNPQDKGNDDDLTQEDLIPGDADNPADELDFDEDDDELDDDDDDDLDDDDDDDEDAQE